jgi:hypothetical protein
MGCRVSTPYDNSSMGIAGLSFDLMKHPITGKVRSRKLPHHRCHPRPGRSHRRELGIQTHHICTAAETRTSRFYLNEKQQLAPLPLAWEALLPDTKALLQQIHEVSASEAA